MDILVEGGPAMVPSQSPPQISRQNTTTLRRQVSRKLSRSSKTCEGLAEEMSDYGGIENDDAIASVLRRESAVENERVAAFMDKTTSNLANLASAAELRAVQMAETEQVLYRAQAQNQSVRAQLLALKQTLSDKEKAMDRLQNTAAVAVADEEFPQNQDIQNPGISELNRIIEIKNAEIRNLQMSLERYQKNSDFRELEDDKSEEGRLLFLQRENNMLKEQISKLQDELSAKIPSSGLEYMKREDLNQNGSPLIEDKVNENERWIGERMLRESLAERISLLETELIDRKSFNLQLVLIPPMRPPPISYWVSLDPPKQMQCFRAVENLPELFPKSGDPPPAKVAEEMNAKESEPSPCESQKAEIKEPDNLDAIIPT